jgi:hypothetical protein
MTQSYQLHYVYMTDNQKTCIKEHVYWTEQINLCRNVLLPRNSCKEERHETLQIKLQKIYSIYDKLKESRARTEWQMRSRPVKNSDRLLAMTVDRWDQDIWRPSTYMKICGQLRPIWWSIAVTLGNTRIRIQRPHQVGYSRTLKMMGLGWATEGLKYIGSTTGGSRRSN